MNVYQIEEILEDHKTWLETDGKKGERANFERLALDFMKLSKADLRKANFQGASLIQTDLREAKLQKANLIAADLTGANLAKANLQMAELNSARLNKANFEGADLREANIQFALLNETNFKHANLTGCSVYGISAWNLKVNNKTSQLDLIITPRDEPVVTVDNLEVAQFIYSILTNKKIRNVINTITNKAVLILGRFTPKRKEVLDAIADKLRTRDLVPIIFDFEKSEEQDIIETVITLASLSKFIIADVTDARVIADELRSFVPDFAVPVVPVFHPSKEEPKPYASLYTLHKKYTWVFEPVEYESKEHLIRILLDQVINRAEIKRLELRDTKKSDSS